MTKETKKKLTIEERFGLCFKERLNEFIKSGDITDEQALTMAAIHASAYIHYLKNKLSEADEDQIELIVKDLGEKVSYFTQMIINVVKKSDLSIDLFIDRLSARSKERPLFQEMLRLIPFMDAPHGSTSRAKLPCVTVKESDKFVYPLDKLNSVVWSFTEEIAEGETLKRNIRTSPKDSEKQTIVFYSIDFDALEKSEDVSITRQLGSYDKRVYTAISNLWMAGNEIISLSQIYHAMGNTSRPPREEIRKINNSITKMRIAHIIVDNTKEHEVNNKYEVFKYDSSLLLFDRITATINGVITDAAIRVRGIPPLMEFALGRKQVSTCDPVMLQSPIKQTDANLRLEDYLLRRIMHMKNNTRTTRKILFSTLFKSCEITTKMQRHRAPDKITTLLDHYKKNGFIVGYIPANDGITIRL